MFRLLPSISFSSGFDSFSFIFNLIYMIVMGLIALLFLSQTDRLIKLFRLKRGFDSQEISIKNLNEDRLFQFGIIIIGLLMIADNIAPFLNFCYLKFKEQVSAKGLDEISGAILSQYIDYNWWVTSGLNCLVGIIILTNNKRISKLFVKTKKNVG